MPPHHVQDLFSAAYDGELSSEQWLRFKEHLAACADCTAAYDAFRTGVDSVRLLPAARMPLPVHLPGGAPVAQRRTASAWLRGLRRVPLVPGGATAVAAVAAAAIALIALTHPSNTAKPATAGLGAAGNPNAALGVQPSCPTRAEAGAAAPASSYSYRETKTDPRRPGQMLVLAASSATAPAGTPLVFYAGLAVPVPTAGPPGAHAPAAASEGLVPCLAVTGLPASEAVSPVPVHAASGTPAPAAIAAPNQAAQPGAATDTLVAPALGGLETITIPAGTPAGTVLHIVATIPADYPSPGDPSLSIELTITVR